MGLLSFLKFKSKSTDPSGATMADASDLAQEARASARRRLIGTTVLLGIGIVSFPLVFESRPRPIPVDIPIEIPAREGVTPLKQPVAKVDARRPETMPADPIDEPATMAGTEPASSASHKGATAAVLATTGALALAKLSDKSEGKAASHAEAASKPANKPEPKVEAAKPAPKPEPKPVPKPEPKAEVKPAPKPEPKVEAKPTAKPEPKPVAKADPKVDAKTDPKASKPAADEGRFVVQIGAFAEVGSAREARMKVEGMGLKTYTQVIESATGRRIRVRVGPYPSKAEADKAAARIKSGGLQAAVLVL